MAIGQVQLSKTNCSQTNAVTAATLGNVMEKLVNLIERERSTTLSK